MAESAKTRIATRFITPIAAAAASAAAGYLVKRGPDYAERVLLPRLRELASEAQDATKDLPDKATTAASSAGDVAHDLTDRAKTLVGSGAEASSSSAGNHRRFTAQELEKRRQERSRSRSQRRKARGR